MQPSFLKLPRHLFGSLALVASLALLVWAGCSNDDNPTKPATPAAPSISMTGAFLSGTANGAMSLTIASGNLAPPLRTRLSSRSVVTASGTIKPTGGASVSLTGTYNTETDTLNLSGGGYTFAGQSDTTASFDAVVGEWTGPGGPGVFGCGQGTTGAPVKTYCGSYVNTAADASGNWDLITHGDEIAGIAFPSDASPAIPFEGLFSGTGTTRTINIAGNDGSLSLTGTGTLTTATNEVSGTWTLTDTSIPAVVDDGTWEGLLCQ